MKPVLGASTAFAVFAGASVFFLPVALEMPPGLGQEILLRAIHLSPFVLAGDALDLHGFVRADGGASAAAGLLLLGISALVATLWIFTRHQAAESWEPRRGGRVLVPLAVLLVLAAPAAFADTRYEPVPPQATVAHGNPNVTVLFARPGDHLLDLGGGFRTPFPVGEWVRVDLLLLFRQNATLPMTNLRIAGTGAEVVFRGANLERVDQAEHHQTADGSLREVVRLPAEARFGGTGSLGRAHTIAGFVLEWEDERGRHSERGDQMLWVHTPDAPTHLAMAGLPSIALCLGAYGLRRWRSR